MTERSSPGIERELAEKINLHLQLGKSGPGFHLSDDDLCMIVKALLAPCSAATESLVEQVASAIDEAVAKWQPGSDQRIKEMAARAAIAAVSDAAQRSGDPLAGLVERLDRLCLTSTENNRVFILATESAQNIVEIVREWIRSDAGARHSTTGETP